MDEVDIDQRHKAEQKELNAKVQALKHSVPKGDKKKKKQVTAEIALLTAQLEERQAQELLVTPNVEQDEQNCNGIESLDLNTENDDTSVPEVSSQPKISKAQKRREKKEAEERARQKRIEDDTADSVNHSRNIEAALFEKILKDNSLKMIEVKPDGNCMYNAIVVNLHGQTLIDKIRKLREDTSDYLLQHIDDFIPFTSNTTTGNMLSPEEYNVYCNEIKETNSWGGELELRAISQIIETSIQVYQAQSPTLLIGEEFESDPIRLSYHRHQYELGEHYNALVVDS